MRRIKKRGVRKRERQKSKESRYWPFVTSTEKRKSINNNTKKKPSGAGGKKNRRFVLTELALAAENIQISEIKGFGWIQLFPTRQLSSQDTRAGSKGLMMVMPVVVAASGDIPESGSSGMLHQK